MTREEALRNCHYSDRHLIECIYDDIESKICETCNEYMHNKCYLLGRPFNKNFYCANYVKRLGNEQESH